MVGALAWGKKCNIMSIDLRSDRPIRGARRLCKLQKENDV